MTFLDEYLAGARTLNEIDDYVARWHEGVIGRDAELRGLLGMNQQEYVCWIKDANFIHNIIAARQIPFSAKS
jgi:hypothetical protein